MVNEAEEVIEPEQVLLPCWKHGSDRRLRQFYTKFKDRGIYEVVWLDEDFFQEYPQLLADYLEAMDQLPS